jgi:hypothetical protein
MIQRRYTERFVRRDTGPFVNPLVAALASHRSPVDGGSLHPLPLVRSTTVTDGRLR